MKYDFDELVERRGTNSLKWDVDDGELPMWVADMDFKAAPEVISALRKKLDTGVFGYQIVPDAWYKAVANWWKKRHGLYIKEEWLCFCTGVIPAITSAVKRITNAGDNVVIQTPVYDIFFHSVENTGRHVLENRLAYSNGEYSMDFVDLEQKLSDPLTTMMILCNPHNPAGRVWKREELERIGALCKKYGVTVLSDEIHCDLTEPDISYVPFANVNEDCAKMSVTCVSASKSFNLAGLQGAAVIVPDEFLRDKIVRGLNSDEVAEPNAFAIEGTVAAFTQGGQWLDELREYISANAKTAVEFINKKLSKITVVKRSATYLLWLDCSAICSDAEELCSYIRKTTGLYVTAGNQYRGNGKTFVRINLACPRARLLDGLERFERGVKGYINK
ncbi:MAG: pyridoxal phosphate-dependent aminotransferase [Clostridia bacterium]|nr:pyridoxal phosphate-dependent aminotransferase [Clostridia bacterium]